MGTGVEFHKTPSVLVFDSSAIPPYLCGFKEQSDLADQILSLELY